MLEQWFKIGMIYRFKQGLVNLPLVDNETVAHIFPWLIHGEQASMEVLIDHFNPYLKDWTKFDELQKKHQENIKDESLAKKHWMKALSLDFFKVS